MFYERFKKVTILSNGEGKALSFDGTDDYEIYFCIFSFTDDSISAAMETQLSDFPDLSIMGVFDETQAGSQYSEFHKMETWEDRVVRWFYSNGKIS